MRTLVSAHLSREDPITWLQDTIQLLLVEDWIQRLLMVLLPGVDTITPHLALMLSWVVVMPIPLLQVMLLSVVVIGTELPEAMHL